MQKKGDLAAAVRNIAGIRYRNLREREGLYGMVIMQAYAVYRC